MLLEGERAIDAWRWPHFTPEEISCHHCRSLVIETDSMDLLESLRFVYGKPLSVTSGYRCPEHNRKVSTTGLSGPHTTGRAFDIAVYGEDAVGLMRISIGSIGWTGFGFRQHGRPFGRFVHLDDIPTEGSAHPRPRIWSYA